MNQTTAGGLNSIITFTKM